MDENTAKKFLYSLLAVEPDKIPNAIKKFSEYDWYTIIQSSNNSINPLLYNQLRRIYKQADIPRTIILELRKSYLQNASRTICLYKELSKVLSMLQQHNIPVIPLKGACLGEVVYGNIALRSMGDIDILVRKSDLIKAKEQLVALGYTPLRQDGVEVACAGSQHLPPMMKQNAIPVELHWTLETPTTPFTIDIEGLWRRAQPVSIAGVDTLTLSPEDLLLHLCLHTSVHHLYSNGLRAFCDIRETIRHYRNELNWETVQNRALEWGAGNAVYLTLHFAKFLLGADVPDDFLKRYRPAGFTPKKVAEFKKYIFWQGSKSISVVKLYHLMSVTEKARFFLRRIFLSPEELEKKYFVPSNSPLICLYYFIRLKDVLLKYRHTVWRIWSRDKATVQQLQLIDWLAR